MKVEKFKMLKIIILLQGLRKKIIGGINVFNK